MHCHVEPVGITYAALFGGPIVETEHLLIQIAEQMERLNTDVGSCNPTLEQRPEVFEPVRVNLPVNVLLRMVNNFVSVIPRQSVIREQRVSVERGASLHVCLNCGLQASFAPIFDNKGANLSATFEHAHHNGFVFSAGTSDAALAFVKV